MVRLEQLTENWGNGVQTPVWAKSLTPGFGLMNHFYEMIFSVTINCPAENLIRMIFTLIYSHLSNWKSSDYKTQLSVKKYCCKVNTTLINVI